MADILNVRICRCYYVKALDVTAEAVPYVVTARASLCGQQADPFVVADGVGPDPARGPASTRSSQPVPCP